MEHKLRLLFDYQKFEKNDRLQRLIDQSLNGSAIRLSEEDLDLVNAAGDPFAASETSRPRDPLIEPLIESQGEP